MVLHTFFEKDNTIISDSRVNTGRNPITELFYGGQPNVHSRYLFKFDIERIKNEIICGKLGDKENLTHTLKMVGTASLNSSLLGDIDCYGKERTSSFTLILCKINKPWDEGYGYDAQTTDPQKTVTNVPSNWFNAKTNVSWDNEGVIDSMSGVTQIVASQSFDMGNENIEMDVTQAVNDLLESNENYGFILSFTEDVETLETERVQYISFFGKDTNSFFEPYIESKSITTLKDSRNDFSLGVNQQLCIYPELNGDQICLDQKPRVTILNDSDEIVTIIEPSGVTKYNGAYCVDINIPKSNSITQCTTYYDVWDNLIFNGELSEPVTNEFFVNKENKISFNLTETKANDYVINVIGIKRGEKILNGDVRKIIVNVKKPYTSNQQNPVQGLEYRLYVREGNAEYTAIDYNPIEMAADTNYFFIDTFGLLPHTYYVDIKVKSNNQIKQHKEILKFDIINQANYRNTYN